MESGGSGEYIYTLYIYIYIYQPALLNQVRCNGLSSLLLSVCFKWNTDLSECLLPANISTTIYMCIYLAKHVSGVGSAEE